MVQEPAGSQRCHGLCREHDKIVCRLHSKTLFGTIAAGQKVSAAQEQEIPTDAQQPSNTIYEVPAIINA